MVEGLARAFRLRDTSTYQKDFQALAIRLVVFCHSHFAYFLPPLGFLSRDETEIQSEKEE
jgi:hypothetical protein